MKTLREFWAFANDATKLSDAQIVAKGRDNWSDLAEQALREAALMISDRVNDRRLAPDDPKTWALEHHPQAFEELSLAIGEALERMWSVVPEAKREEPAVFPVPCQVCGRLTDGCCTVRREKPFTLQEIDQQRLAIETGLMHVTNTTNFVLRDPEAAKQNRMALLQQQMADQQQSHADRVYGQVYGTGLGRHMYIDPALLMPPECGAHRFVNAKNGRYCLRCTRTYPNE